MVANLRPYLWRDLPKDGPLIVNGKSHGNCRLQGARDVAGHHPIEWAKLAAHPPRELNAGLRYMDVVPHEGMTSHLDYTHADMFRDSVHAVQV